MSRTMLALSALAILGGCTTYTTPRYALYPETQVALRSVSGPKFAVSEPVQPVAFNAHCRGLGPITVADNISIDAYVRKAIVDELRVAGMYSEAGPRMVSFNLSKASFVTLTEERADRGRWNLAMELRISEAEPVHVEEVYEFAGDLSPYRACKAATEALLPAVQNIVLRAVTHPMFKKEPRQ